MDDAKYPAFDTKPYRIVKSRSEASVPVNVAPTYYIVASDLQGFPLQQAIPLVQMSTNAQLAPRPPENQLPPLPVPRPGTPMRWYIASLLRCLGVPARLSGFNYLVETLLLVNRPFETRLVTGEVYPVVAKQCNTTPIGAVFLILRGRIWGQSAAERRERQKNCAATRCFIRVSQNAKFAAHLGAFLSGNSISEQLQMPAS